MIDPELGKTIEKLLIFAGIMVLIVGWLTFSLIRNRMQNNNLMEPQRIEHEEVIEGDVIESPVVSVRGFPVCTKDNEFMKIKCECDECRTTGMGRYPGTQPVSLEHFAVGMGGIGRVTGMDSNEKATEFCHWLKGFFEIHEANEAVMQMSSEQVELIREKLFEVLETK